MLKNVPIGSTCAWMLSFLSFVVINLAGHFSSKWILSFLCAVVICFSFVRSKFRQTNNDVKEPPKIPTMTVTRVLYNALKDRRRCKTLMMGLLFGTCLWYPIEGMHIVTVATKKFLMLYNLKAVEFVLSSKTILRKGFVYDFLKDRMKEGLITSAGQKWRERRKLLVPAFRVKTLKEFFPVFNKHAEALVLRISEKMEKQEVIDISRLASACALDVSTDTVLGKSTDSQGRHRNVNAEAFDKCAEICGERAFSPWMWNEYIFQRTKLGKMSCKYLGFINRFVNQAINESKWWKSERQNSARSSSDVPANDDLSCKSKQNFTLLDYLIEMHLKDENFTIEGVEEESQTFIVAGHDTTSGAISWTLYMIGLHEDVQRRVHEEIDMVFGDDMDRMITTEDVKELKYLNCVLKETMRLYPSVAIVSRALQEDTVINGYKISKDTTILIPIYMVHRNPEIFPNPEVFNPDRFSQMKIHSGSSFAYIPFSAGPRNCIGQNFAINEVIAALVWVLRQFSVTAVEQRDKIKLSFDIVLGSENGILLKFTKRNY